METLIYLWGTYSRMREQDMVCSVRDEDDQTANFFNTFTDTADQIGSLIIFIISHMENGQRGLHCVS